MRVPRWFFSGCALFALVSFSACSNNYQPPSHTYTGFPEYGGIGVSVWGGGVVAPVLIGDPVIGVPPDKTPDVILKQTPLDPIF